LSYLSKITRYVRTGREGEGATLEIINEERGGEISVEMGEQVAGQSRYRIVGGNQLGH
jgi:hypothetical protein